MGFRTTDGFQVAAGDSEASQPAPRALLSWVFPAVLSEIPAGPFCHHSQLCDKQSCVPTKPSGTSLAREQLPAAGVPTGRCGLGQGKAGDQILHLSRTKLLTLPTERTLRQGPQEESQVQCRLTQGKESLGSPPLLGTEPQE